MSSKLIRIFWKVFFYGLGGFILFLILINLGVFGSLPSLKELENPSITLATEVFAEDGTAMGKYYKDKGNRSNVEFRDISTNVVNALVATEDERFYDHSGIDGQSLSVNLLRARRSRNISAHGSNLSATDHNRSVVDFRTTNGNDMRVPNHVSWQCRIGELRIDAIGILSDNRSATKCCDKEKQYTTANDSERVKSTSVIANAG